MTSLTTTLNNGVEMPLLGIGTWKANPGEVEAALEHAIVNTGIRHIDGATIYRNEQEVGEGIFRALATGAVKREDLFITTKVWPSYWNRVETSLDSSLKEMGLDYVDLLLVHWPIGFNPKGNDNLTPTLANGDFDYDPTYNFKENWAQFEAVYKNTKKVRAIGVSNFSIPNLEKLLESAEIVPAVNQIESHPLLTQPELEKYCKDKGILVEAWRPLAASTPLLLENPEILRIASKHNVPVGTILISWHLAEGRCVIPKSVKASRIDSNAIYAPLDKDDLEVIDNLHKTVGTKRFGPSPFANGFVHFDDWD
ncbi:hypothetical protein D0Z03_002455 [Geotrichum reessii]|nr:hypothetical protein D0Z03_002455 [Galactomyces reessii]